MSATSEERAKEAVEHLQAAALQMIAAMRAALDVAEELVADPGALVVAAQAAGEVLAPFVEKGRQAAEAVVAQAAARATADPASADAASGPTRRPRVEHIRVS